MKNIIEFFENYSWLANLLAILIGAITISGFILSFYRKIKSHLDEKNTYSTVTNYVRSCHHYDVIKVLKKHKIAIIDDQPENYPIDYLRKSGFNISIYEEVSLADYSFIALHDLVFMDITNVVKEDPQRGGFELMKRVRSEMSGIILIGVSSKRFDPTLTEFFKLADEQAKTPISEKDCENLILKTLEKYYSPTHISGEIDDLLNKSLLTQKHHKKTLQVIIKYINSSLDDDKLYQALSGINKNLDVYKVQEKCRSLKDVL